MGILFCKEEILRAEDLERKALEDVYHALNGFWWEGFRKENWLSSKPIGEWSGVYTDGSGRVIELLLSYNNQNGSSANIPDSIGNLKHLQELTLTCCILGNKVACISHSSLL